VGIFISVFFETNIKPVARIIQGLVVEIVADIGALYKASEAVSAVQQVLIDSTDSEYPGCACGYAVVIFSCINQSVRPRR